MCSRVSAGRLRKAEGPRALLGEIDVDVMVQPGSRFH